MRSIRNCTVAVTGGAGFIGSHLVHHLIDDRQCQVIVIDNLCVGRREFIHPKALFIHHDITGSEEFMRQVFRRHSVDFVMSYASWPYIPDSFERPLQVFSVNATGAIKVINAAQEAGCKGILQVSSAELYGDADSESHITESHPVAPHSSYGTAKAAVDYYCQCAWKERETPVIALRQFNCLGERETHSYVIPEIIGQLDSHPPTLLLGNNSTRDFMYAGDAVRMATELLEKGQFGEVYNLGSEVSIQIHDLARLIGRIMNVDVNIITNPKKIRPWEIWHLQSDNTKIHSVIESRPEIDLEEALKRTISWYHEHGWWWENATVPTT